MEKEIWKDIPGYEGYYMASNFGRIKSLGKGLTHKTVKILKPGYVGRDKLYRVVTLYKNGILKHHRVCRLVWSAFNGPIPPGMQINHINEVKNDDRLVNLNLMTPKENNNWGTRIDRVRETNINHPSKSKPVYQYTLNDELIAWYPSINQAERETGISDNCISGCCQKKYGFKTAGGFKWRYA